MSERSDGDPGEDRKARNTPGEGRKPRSAPGEDRKPKARPGGSDKPKSGPGGMSPTARRHARRRKEQLDLIREQVKDGSLVIRQMTPEERKKYPPRPRKPKRSNRKR